MTTTTEIIAADRTLQPPLLSEDAAKSRRVQRPSDPASNIGFSWTTGAPGM